MTTVHASVQLRDTLQSIKESLRSDDSAEIRPGPWSLDVHPDEGPIPEPFELEADFDRMMKVSTFLPPNLHRYCSLRTSCGQLSAPCMCVSNAEGNWKNSNWKAPPSPASCCILACVGRSILLSALTTPGLRITEAEVINWAHS